MAATSTILDAFGKLGITIFPHQIQQMEKMTLHFTLRDTHPLTFDGPYLGLHPLAFKTSDRNALFDIFNVHEKDVEQAIRECPEIDRTRNVTSDSFNLLSMWLCHLAPIYIKDKHVRDNFMRNVMRYLLYKFFCSVVNNSFRHGTVEGVLLFTISKLTLKSDIIRLESWRRLIESHVDKILNQNDRFYTTLISATPDEDFLKALANIQTEIRAKIVTYATAYYDAHAAGDKMGFTSLVAQNAEGEKIIAQTASVIDSASKAMTTQLMNPNTFIRDTDVKDIADLHSTISDNMLRLVLLKINETAVMQAKSRTLSKVVKDKDGDIYIGAQILVEEIIRTCVRICRIKKVNMGNRRAVFEAVRQSFSSSRNLDPDVLAIKRSIAFMIDPFEITSNPASQAALRLATIYYICYRSILHMKP